MPARTALCLALLTLALAASYQREKREFQTAPPGAAYLYTLR